MQNAEDAPQNLIVTNKFKRNSLVGNLFSSNNVYQVEDIANVLLDEPNKEGGKPPIQPKKDIKNMGGFKFKPGS